MDNKNNENSDNKAKQIEAQLKHYTGPEGITAKQLEIGLWYVKHKQFLKKILYGFLIMVSAVSWSYFIYGFSYYLARGMKEDEILTRQLIEANSIGHDYVLQLSAKSLVMAPVEVLKSTDKKYDLYVRLQNDNPKWWAEFDYYFIAAGRPTAKAKGFILPQEAKNFLTLAQDFDYEPSLAEFIMENLKWHRLDQHKIPDWSAYYLSRLNIEIKDIKFTPASASLLSEKLNLNQLSFRAGNQTAYNFWQTGFAILLYGAGGLVNLNYYTLDDFMSGQERFIEISWPGQLGFVDKIEIIPEINIMRDDVYIPYEGGVGKEK